MMVFILVIHTIVCVLLVLAVLMQSGRGGGLTEQFASAESVFGAQTSSFMVRATSILAAIFFVTSLSLAFMSARQETSLMVDYKPVAKTNKVSEMVISKEVAQDASQTLNAAMAVTSEALPAAEEVAQDAVENSAPIVDALTPVVANVQN